MATRPRVGSTERPRQAALDLVQEITRDHVVRALRTRLREMEREERFRLGRLR